MKTEERIEQVIKRNILVSGCSFDFDATPFYSQTSFEIHSSLLAEDAGFDFVEWIKERGFNRQMKTKKYCNQNYPRYFFAFHWNYKNGKEMLYIFNITNGNGIPIETPTSELRAIILFESLNIK